MPQAGWLMNDTHLSHRSGGCKSEIRVPARLSPGENLLSGSILPSAHCILSWRRAEKRGKLSDDSCKGASLILGLLPPPVASSNPNHVPKTPPPNIITWRGRISKYEWGGYIHSVHKNRHLLFDFIHCAQQKYATHHPKMSLP